jgi:N4-gp56 family major capsid protein
MANTVSIDALRPELWQKELYKDVMDGLYLSKYMGEGENNIIQTKSDLKKSTGDTVTLPLTAKLTGNGVTGDSELEGNEEAISAYSESIAIDQCRNAVRLTGKLDEQKNAYNMRMDAKDKLSMWLQEFIERQFFFKLGGVTNTALTDVNGTVVGGRCQWSNAAIPTSGTRFDQQNTDTNNGYGDRYLCADYTSGATSLAATDLLTPELISRAKTKAKLASPMVRPLRIEGKDYYVMFIHPWQAYDLKNNATFAQAQREAQVRGNSNPIFTGALGIWDGVIIEEHEYVPFLDVSEVGDSFMAGTSNTDFAVDTFRACLCGKQALGFVQTKDSMSMVEETFNYKNQVGYATGLIGGIQRVEFNNKQYGVINVDTAATALV